MRLARAKPVTVTSIISGPGDRVMLPPARVTRASAARSRNPSTSACISSTTLPAGRASESNASRGVPPIAATSERLTANAFHPMSRGVLKRRSKWTPSTSPSVVRISSAPRSGFTTAASSPMPMSSHGGAAGTRARIPAISSRSPVPSAVEGSVIVAMGLPGKFRSPRFTDDRPLDLSRVLELVLDPARDVLREPDRLFVRYALAFDDDTDVAAGLERKSFQHAGERVRDALELLEALHVGLENVAACPRTRRRDGVGRLADHRFERR